MNCTEKTKEDLIKSENRKLSGIYTKIDKKTVTIQTKE